ncbi:tail fiber domain-containing protein [uncultured Dokdonia sp.]|uniref:tail fiber domain-containing protein n=1 Tax=uncultured Dokdonia sp. TaxID=575653 RepID=UPI002623E758|nr:tail fiber domain-containing protein [uncultured Dokdonia sp.]
MKNTILTCSLFLGFITQTMVAQQTTTNLGAGSGTNGNDNTNIGYQTGPTTTGFSNTFVGSLSGSSNTTGRNNAFVGKSSGQSNTTGNGNVYLGNDAMTSNQTGHNNVAVGNRAGSSNSAGSRNVFLGTRTGMNNQGFGNVFIGNRAGEFESGNDKLYIDNTQTSTPLIHGDFATDLVSINGRLFVNGSIQSNSGLAVSSLDNYLAITRSLTPGKWSFSTGSSVLPGPTPPLGSTIFMNVDQASKNIGIGQNSSTEFAQFTITNSGVPLAFENSSTANNAGGLWRFFQVGNAVGFDVNTGSTGNEFGNNYKRPLRMSNNGNVGRVGIGITLQNPSYELDVNGTIRASSVITNSDKRFKQNITPITNALDKINAMEGVSYQFKEFKKEGYNLPSEEQFGLIAQDVQKIAPHIVKEDEQGYLGIDYIKIIPLLIESVKEQQASITTLQEENEDLKQAIRQLTGEDTNTSKKASIDAILYQNTPNPLQDQTTITYQLSKEAMLGNAVIEIYDFNGTVIKRYTNLKEGRNSIEVQSSLLTSRVTFYRLIVKGEVIATKKMLKR